MFSFLHREYVDLEKGSLRNKNKKKHVLKMEFKYMFFVCVKGFQPIIRVENNSQVYNFTHSSHRISVLLRLRRDFVIRNWLENKGLIYMLLCKDFIKFDV